MANPEDANGADTNGQERLRQETEEREVRGLQSFKGSIQSHQTELNM